MNDVIKNMWNKWIKEKFFKTPPPSELTKKDIYRNGGYYIERFRPWWFVIREIDDEPMAYFALSSSAIAYINNKIKEEKS